MSHKHHNNNPFKNPDDLEQAAKDETPVEDKTDNNSNGYSAWSKLYR